MQFPLKMQHLKAHIAAGKVWTCRPKAGITQHNFLQYPVTQLYLLMRQHTQPHPQVLPINIKKRCQIHATSHTATCRGHGYRVRIPNSGCRHESLKCPCIFSKWQNDISKRQTLLRLPLNNSNNNNTSGGSGNKTCSGLNCSAAGDGGSTLTTGCHNRAKDVPLQAGNKNNNNTYKSS